MTGSDERTTVPPVLSAHGLVSGYGALAAVRDVDLAVRPGEIVALIGPNGAGKTTTLLTLAGELTPMEGAVRWRGASAKTGLWRRARHGLGFVPEERSVVMGMSVHDNLRIGRGGTERALELFPELRKLLRSQAGLLSGGEQQMLALGRALAGRPEVLLADELSLGLAPVVVDRLLRAVRQAAEEDGTGVLMVEQQARRALGACDRWYLMRQGRVIDAGDRADGHRAEAGYMGAGAAAEGESAGTNDVLDDEHDNSLEER